MYGQIRILLAILLALAIGPLGHGVVFGHTGYERSNPGKSESVDEPPETVDIWMWAPLMPAVPQQIWVENEEGDTVAESNDEVSPEDYTHLQVALPPDLPDGRYTVSWRVQSMDTMYAQGSFRFYIGVKPTPEQIEEDARLEERIAITDGGAGPAFTATVILVATVLATVLGGGTVVLLRRRRS